MGLFGSQKAEYRHQSRVEGRKEFRKFYHGPGNNWETVSRCTHFVTIDVDRRVGRSEKESTQQLMGIRPRFRTGSVCFAKEETGTQELEAVQGRGTRIIALVPRPLESDTVVATK